MLYYLLLFFIHSIRSEQEVIEDGRKLVMITALWRHGSRAPSSMMKNDWFNKNNFDWPQGGGGRGQLDTIGMEQQIRLGEQIRQRYIEGKPYKFLNDFYKSNEIYIRSTDVNRTIVSAISNMLGMYGIDYPVDKYWPEGFVPIPIHSVENYRDSMFNIACTYIDDLFHLAEKTPQYQAYYTDPELVKEYKFLSQQFGEEINSSNYWKIIDSLKIENTFYPDLLRNHSPWFTNERMKVWDGLHRKHMAFFMGIGLDDTLVDGIDVQTEMNKIRAGYNLGEIFDRFDQKLNCQNSTDRKCMYFNNLKYYAYSAHDLTLFGLLAGLGYTDEVLPVGDTPDYTSAIFFELWQDSKTDEPTVRILYRKGPEDNLNTSYSQVLPACGGHEFCRLDDLRKQWAKFKPVKPFEELCWQHVDPVKINTVGSASGNLISGFMTLSLIFSLFAQ